MSEPVSGTAASEGQPTKAVTWHEVAADVMAPFYEADAHSPPCEPYVEAEGTAPEPLAGHAVSVEMRAAQALRDGLDQSRRSPGDWIVAFEQVHDRAEVLCGLLLGPRPTVPVRDEPQA